MLLVVVYGDEDHAVVGEEGVEEVEAGPHHAEPLVGAEQVFAGDRAVLGEPAAH